MRKHLRALAALCVLGASAGVVGSGPTIAAGDEVDPTKGLIDVTSSIASLPTTVAPPGETALFTASIKNVGAIALDAELTVDLVTGAAFRPELSSALCTASADDAVCDAPALAPGETRSFEVVANTAPSAGAQITEVRAAVVGLTEPLEHQSNNTSTATTTVLAPNSEYRAGLVEEGESIELALADGRRYTLRVPEGVPGVIVRKLAPQSGAGKSCGTSACRDGFVLDFVQHPYYQAQNPLNPLITNRTFGPQGPCLGLGAPACSSIYYAKSEAATNLSLMPDCAGTSGGEAGSGIAIPSPCINQRYKVNGLIWFDVRLLSDDPIELAPVLLG